MSGRPFAAPPPVGYLSVSLLQGRAVRLAVEVAGRVVELDFTAFAGARIGHQLQALSEAWIRGLDRGLPCSEDGSIRWRADGSVQLIGAYLYDAPETVAEYGVGLGLRLSSGGQAFEAGFHTAFEAFGHLHEVHGEPPEHEGSTLVRVAPAVEEFNRNLGRTADGQRAREPERDGDDGPGGGA